MRRTHSAANSLRKQVKRQWATPPNSRTPTKICNIWNLSCHPNSPTSSLTALIWSSSSTHPTPSNPVNPMPKRSIHTLKSVLLIYSNTKAGVFDWKREQWFFLDTQTVINAICIGPPSNLTDKKNSFIRDCLRISFFRFVIYFCACVCTSETREGIRHPGAGVLGGHEDLNWNECWNLNSGPPAEQHTPSSVLSNFSSPQNVFVVIVDFEVFMMSGLLQSNWGKWEVGGTGL